MVKCDSLKKLAEVLAQADKILIFTHVLMDGDTLGSSVALCRALRMMGKEASVLIGDGVPEYLAFLDQGYCTFDQDVIQDPDVCIAVDCSDIGRFEKRKEIFHNCKTTICVDHHFTNNAYADLNYIDANAAATGEIMFRLLVELGSEIDKETAEAIYTAIVTDTGNFQYSSTTKDTHLIAAKLFDLGIDHNRICVELYQNVRLEKLLVTSAIQGTLQLSADGLIDLAYVTQDMLAEIGATIDETEGVIENLRSISGVEIAIFLKELAPGEIKVGLRAKSYGDVAAIAQVFQGGGHKKAAGCTIHASMEAAKQQILLEANEQLMRTRQELGIA